MLRFFSVLTAVLVVVAFASPLSSALSVCCGEVAAECGDAGCTDSGCEPAPGGCVHCGPFAKMLVAAGWSGIRTRPAGAWSFTMRTQVFPDGFVPSIDQPPRAA